LAWGALVFGELTHLSPGARLFIIGGSLIMIAGAVAISFAEAPASEQAAWSRAIKRECARYQMHEESVAAAVRGEERAGQVTPKRHWWEAIVVLVAIGIFIVLGLYATRQEIAISLTWMAVLVALSLAFLAVCGFVLWRRTRFS
jgi:hypothetical protein